MIKKIGFAVVLLASVQCTDYTTTTTVPAVINAAQMASVTDGEINLGLKEALNAGILSGISGLGQDNGFYNNSLVMIMLPPELKQVDQALRKFGLGKLSDEGIKLLNRAAEDAVTTATPIFTNALNNMTFNDVRNVLLGDQNSATQYLQNATTSQLVSAFSPKIAASLNKVGANKAWSDIIKQYNMLTGNNLNSDLTQYVTQQAVNGVFLMVAQKEKDIRTNINSRTTNVMKKVFALQD